MRRLLYRQFNKKNLLIVNLLILEEKNDFPNIKIIFEFYEDYTRKNFIKIALSLFDLRQMKFATDEVIKKGETKWVKFTEKNGEKKRLTINSSYITAHLVDKNYFIGFQFASYYEFLAFRDEITFFIKTAETALQKFYEKG